MSKRIHIVVTLALAFILTGRAAPAPAQISAPRIAAEVAPIPVPVPPVVQTQPLAETLDLRVIDKPYDNGTAIMMTWKKMPHEGPDVFYELMMSNKPEGPFWSQGKMVSQKPAEGETSSAPFCPLMSDFPASFGFAASNEGSHAVEVGRFIYDGLVLHADKSKMSKDEKDELAKAKEEFKAHHVVDDKKAAKPYLKVESVSDSLKRGKKYYFKLRVIRGPTTFAVGKGQVVSSAASSNWFAWHKLNLMIAMLVLSAIIMAYAKIAQRDPTKLFIRRIGGLEAVDEALGRAAEMGRPVFFCHGPGGLTEVVTISALNMLGKVAERVGEYGIQMKVTCLNYLVMQVSQEMVRDAYTRVGRPDAYKDDDVFFVSQSTFAYSAAVGGMMIREKAGTAFYFGRFGSESLLLSETGAITKAIQIAGTDSFNQIPFFITTCDYTLIGEEMYAASAYLSREPRLVGAVKGQDVVKVIIITLIVTGAVLASFGVVWFARLFWPLTN